MYQINDDIPLGCIYESEDSSTKYCPMCNHDNVPYCQWFEDEPEAAIGIDERPVYCPILPSAQPEPCVDTGILDRFSIYQIEWLRSHNDIEFVPDEEDLIVRFLNDTLHCFKLEHQEKVDTPTVDTPTCEDAVSRQAVYNVLDKMPVRGFKKDGETIHGLISLSQVNSAIIDLPSVQPEIIHCGECKHRDPEDHKCDCGHDIIWQLPRDDKWYCADAERRTDEHDDIFE